MVVGTLRRLGMRSLSDRFALYRDELGLDGDLSPQCLRDSYATHLIEDSREALTRLPQFSELE